MKIARWRFADIYMYLYDAMHHAYKNNDTSAPISGVKGPL